jgi:L-rhamnose isomerase
MGRHIHHYPRQAELPLGKRFVHTVLYAAYACMAAFLAIGPVMDYKMFDRIFVKADIPDLSVRFVLEGSLFY